MTENPAAKITKLKMTKRPDGKPAGHRIWTEAEQEQYRQFWPVGTIQRLAFDLLQLTGLRISDAYRFGRSHLAPDGSFEIINRKTGTTSHGYMSSDVLASINATRTGEDIFLTTDLHKRPFATAGSFGSWFILQCRRAGLPSGLSAHGIRKATATAVATDGATEYELMSMMGWINPRTAAIYTALVNRKAAGTRAAKRHAERNQNIVAFPGQRKRGGF
jgi:integrase